MGNYFEEIGIAIKFSKYRITLHADGWHVARETEVSSVNVQTC